MSRLIVKNLPKNVTEQKLREIFVRTGRITDIQLKYTKEGKFRQFGFIGFEDDASALECVKYFNQTFINTSKITVEVCAALGDESKPKSWSRYAKDSTTFQNANKVEVEPEIVAETAKPVKKDKKTKVQEIIGDHKNDPLFLEFMKSHAKGATIWDNDLETVKNDDETLKNDDHADFEATEEMEEETSVVDKVANKEISDLDYMQSLMNKEDPTYVIEDKTPSTVKKESSSKKDMIKLFTIKIRNIPKKVKREELIKFFRPSKAHSVRIPTDSKLNYAYVGFKTERDLQRAITKDKSFFNGKQVHVYDFTAKNKLPNKDGAIDNRNPRWQQQEEMLKNEETICESGKLFFRNLAYSVNEDDLQKIFEPYGNIVEVNVPIDSITRKIKGFGTVTFLMPEHAVKAYGELNGTLFHGRMFHILPGKANDTQDDDEDENSTNYKAKKQKELKKTAGSSHNWNTLFLGENAVAEILSKNFGKSKEEILGTADGGSSAAVRLALGETQIVMEMQQFLEDNDVHLDAFNDATSKRSKTVILAKNLPADTQADEIRQVFTKFGILGRVVMPPSGVTALVEFVEPSEARKAFKKLAYTKFKYVPLYLEWAPEKTFGSKETKNDLVINDTEKPENVRAPKTNDRVINTKANSQMPIKPDPEILAQAPEEPQEEEDDSPPESDTTLFIKNLNFNTEEQTVRIHFRHLGSIHLIQVAKKKDPDNPTQMISLGYGFIQFKQKSGAERALKTMQFHDIDGKKIELKRSDRTLQSDNKGASRKQTDKSEQKNTTKIMVRNIPFQANIGEIRDIFKAFGEIKALRLPKKMTPGASSHRGFGFIDYFTKGDAKQAYDALHHSTHLYGRRLVLEWAAEDESVEDIRKRTAEHFGNSESGAEKKTRKSVFKTDHIKFDDDDEDD